MNSHARGPLAYFAAGALAVALPLGAAFAAGGGGGGNSEANGSKPTIASNDAAEANLQSAQDAIKREQYYVAIDNLQKVLDKLPNNPDALNLMGFSKRKTGHPEESLEYYNKALAQNPNHVGANEYLGELYLEMKDVKRAEERLAVLGRACGTSCEEYAELKEKIEKYKATQG